MLIKILAVVATCVGLAWMGWSTLSSAADELVIGRATISDGNTFEIDGERLRLWAVITFDRNQRCDYNGKVWSCGLRAALELDDWIGDTILICRRREKTFDRSIVSCMNGPVDVGSWMVASGWAVADRCSSPTYVAAEVRAMARKVGVWSSRFQRPTNPKLNDHSRTRCRNAVDPNAQADASSRLLNRLRPRELSLRIMHANAALIAAV